VNITNIIINSINKDPAIIFIDMRFEIVKVVNTRLNTSIKKRINKNNSEVERFNNNNRTNKETA